MIDKNIGYVLIEKEIGSAMSICPIHAPHMNKYLSRFKPRYVKGTAEVLNCATSLWTHPIMGVMIMMMLFSEELFILFRGSDETVGSPHIGNY